MSVAAALDYVDLNEAESPSEIPDAGAGVPTERCVDLSFIGQIDPTDELIASINVALARGDFRGSGTATFVLPRPATAPLALVGTFQAPACDEEHAGRCRSGCESRCREWRAELDCDRSGIEADVARLTYRLRWTSGFYVV